MADLRRDCIDEIDKICIKTEKKNRSYSSYNPLFEETELISQAIFNEGNHINGLTNASIRKVIFPNASDYDKYKKQS